MQPPNHQPCVIVKKRQKETKTLVLNKMAPITFPDFKDFRVCEFSIPQTLQSYKEK